MEKRFELRARGTNARIEIMAGLTTFMTMAYILMVNSSMFATLEGLYGVSYNAVYIATAISAIVGSALIGLMANMPLAMASGMGLNAFFVYTVCLGFGFSYANGLVMVLFDGVLFILLTVTGLRKIIFDAIPQAVKQAIPAGIGMFIAYIGLQNAGIIIADTSTCSAFVSLNMFTGSATWAGVMPVIATFAALLLISALTVKKVRGSVFWGILGGAAIYYLFALTIPGFYDGFLANVDLNPLAAFGDFFDQAFMKVFTEGFDFSAYIAEHGVVNFLIVLVTTMLAFCMVDMFDTMATLYGACARGNLLDEQGNVPKMEKAMLSDAIATCTGAICGTSTVTTVVEAAAGMAEGGRTGLAALVTAAMFFIAMFLTPIAALIPSCATAAALIYVGILMMSGVRDIEWSDIEIAVPAFLTIAMMPFTYNISYGIGLGVIAYTLIEVFAGKVKKVSVGTWVIDALFIIMFFLTH